MWTLIDSEDEENQLALKKREGRKKHGMVAIKAWQDCLMAETYRMVLQESGKSFLLKHEVTQKFNEVGMPLTWYRLQRTGIMFEKSINMPPFALSQKFTAILPQKSKEENLERAEQLLCEIVVSKFVKNHSPEKPFRLPIRSNDVQREYYLTHQTEDPPLFMVMKQFDVN
jgi:hypothetical protein